MFEDKMKQWARDNGSLIKGRMVEYKNLDDPKGYIKISTFFTRDPHSPKVIFEQVIKQTKSY